MADQEEVGVDLVVAQRLPGLGRFQLGRQLQVAALPAGRLLDDLPGRARAGAGIPMLRRLPFRSSKVSIFASLRATMVTGSARSEEHTSELQSLMRISYDV